MDARPQHGIRLVTLSADEIGRLLAGCDLPVDASLAERLATYLELLTRWNARTNLTAIRDPRQIVLRHFADSLFCARHISSAARTLLDFGSGAGLPGIPIALSRPGIYVTLAESQGRKAAFLREVVRTLELRAEVWGDRVESMPPGMVFDAVALRAVDRMESACQAAAHRIAPRGQMLILTTNRSVEGLTTALPQVSFQPPLRLPHSEQGVLLVATC